MKYKAVVRIRGTVGVRDDLQGAMENMKLKRKHNCVLVKDDETGRGMLQKVKDFTAFGDVDEATMKKLIVSRGETLDGKKISEKEADKIVKGLSDGKRPKELGIKAIFRLSPPKKGYKSTRLPFPRGDLGNRKEKMAELLERMI